MKWAMPKNTVWVQGWRPKHPYPCTPRARKGVSAYLGWVRLKWIVEKMLFGFWGGAPNTHTSAHDGPYGPCSHIPLTPFPLIHGPQLSCSDYGRCGSLCLSNRSLGFLWHVCLHTALIPGMQNLAPLVQLTLVWSNYTIAHCRQHQPRWCNASNICMRRRPFRLLAACHSSRHHPTFSHPQIRG